VQDVFFLRTAELQEASGSRAQGTARPDLALLARERRILREAQRRLEPPISVPPHGRMKFGPIDMAMFEPKPRSAGSGPSFKGFAVSPGQVTAPASVIRSPDDFDQMGVDTILVCPTTTPAWTPLFARAKGLVTDIGGALAHGSIVAREYGIPAVMGTGVATQRIETGQLIGVDGDRGTVTLLDEVEAGHEELQIAERAAEQEKAASRKRLALLALAAGLVLGLFVWCRKRRCSP
jgi:pyruvate,water dikinase